MRVVCGYLNAKFQFMLITYQMESLEELLESITSTLQSQYSSRFIRLANPMGLHFLGYGEERHQLKVEDYSELEGAILELRRDKPEYTQAEIARKLGCDAMRVSRTLKKYGKNK